MALDPPVATVVTVAGLQPAVQATSPYRHASEAGVSAYNPLIGVFLGLFFSAGNPANSSGWPGGTKILKLVCIRTPMSSGRSMPEAGVTTLPLPVRWISKVPGAVTGARSASCAYNAVQAASEKQQIPRTVRFTMISFTSTRPVSVWIHSGTGRARAARVNQWLSWPWGKWNQGSRAGFWPVLGWAGNAVDRIAPQNCAKQTSSDCFR